MLYILIQFHFIESEELFRPDFMKDFRLDFFKKFNPLPYFYSKY
jgi:hypothetical protein